MKVEARTLRRWNPLVELNRDPTALMSQVPIRDSVPLKTELTTAQMAFSEAQHAVVRAFEDLRRGTSLDIPQLDEAIGSMVDSMFRNRDAMGWMVRLKNTDDYLHNHALAVGVWALTFGRHLGLDKETLKLFGLGAILLDVGKIELPPALLKKSAKLSELEWRFIRKHVEQGIELLRTSGGIDERILTMIATHHERFDGSGYPRQLKGDEIPLLGRMAGLADSYDAMIAHRCYATPKSAYDAVCELKQLGGTGFPIQLVELFIQAVGVFPTGTLVELNSGDVGVVIGQNRFRRLRPRIMLILDAQRRMREQFSSIDLLTCEGNAEHQQPALCIKRGLERGAYGIDPAQCFLSS